MVDVEEIGVEFTRTSAARQCLGVVQRDGFQRLAIAGRLIS